MSKTIQKTSAYQERRVESLNTVFDDLRFNNKPAGVRYQASERPPLPYTWQSACVHATKKDQRGQCGGEARGYIWRYGKKGSVSVKHLSFSTALRLVRQVAVSYDHIRLLQ